MSRCKLLVSNTLHPKRTRKISTSSLTSLLVRIQLVVSAMEFKVTLTWSDSFSFLRWLYLLFTSHYFRPIPPGANLLKTHMLLFQLGILANPQQNVHQLNLRLTKCWSDAHTEPKSVISLTLVYTKILLKPTFREDVSLILMTLSNAIAWDTVKEQTLFTHRNCNLASVKIRASFLESILQCNLLMLLLQLLQLLLLQIMLQTKLLQDTPRHQPLQAILWPPPQQLHHATSTLVLLSTSNTNAFRALKPSLRKNKLPKLPVLSV